MQISLSLPSLEENYIAKTVKKFDESIAKYHGDISNNLLYLSSTAINLVYAYYKQLSDLKIELDLMNENKECDMAVVSIFYTSQLLANTTIEMQEIFRDERPEMKAQFDKTQQEMMNNICGKPPTEKMKQKYKLFKQSHNVN